MSIKKFHLQFVVSLISVIFVGGCISSPPPTPFTQTSIPEHTLPTISATMLLSVTPTLVNTPTPTKISTPTSTQVSPTASPLPNSSLTSVPTSNPPPGWIAYDVGDSIGIIHTSGLGRRTINSRLMHIQEMDWSPDGQSIAVVGKTDWYGYTEIYVIASDGSTQNRITYLQDRDFILDVSWAPDGKSLVFSTETGVYLYEFSPPRIRKLVNDLRLKYVHVVYTKSDKIVFNDSQQPNVWIINNDGSDLKSLFQKSDGMENGIDVSPDETRVVITSESGLIIVNLDGDHRFQVTTNQSREYDMYPNWSPDGNWIVFQRFIGRVPGDIYMVEVNGRGLTKLISGDNQYISHPRWFPLPALEAGKEFSVTKLGAGVKLYASPNSDDDVLATLKEDDVIMVLEGPVENETYLWSLVRLANNGLEGWVIDTPGWWQPVK